MEGQEKQLDEQQQNPAQAASDEPAEPEGKASDVTVTEELASGEATTEATEQTSDAESTPAEEVATQAEAPAPEAPPEEVPAQEAPSEEAPAEEVAEAKPSKPRKIKKPEVEEDDVVLAPDEAPKDWYILKVSFNREETVRDAILKTIKMSGLEGYFGDVLVPTEDIVEFTRSGKRKIVKRKLYPGYLMIYMHVNDDTWFAIRDTNGVSDFTGTAGKPAPMDPEEVERVIKADEPDEDGEKQLKTSIPFKVGERVRVKEGNFQNQEGEVDKLDEANGRISVNISIFGRSVPVELDHWQVEPI